MRGGDRRRVTITRDELEILAHAHLSRAEDLERNVESDGQGDDWVKEAEQLRFRADDLLRWRGA